MRWMRYGDFQIRTARTGAAAPATARRWLSRAPAANSSAKETPPRTAVVPKSGSSIKSRAKIASTMR